MRALIALTFSVVAVAAAACSGSNAGVADPNTTPNADGGPGTPDPHAPPDPTKDGGPSGDAQPTSDAQPKEDGGGVDDRIDPIALGRSWTYDVSIIGFYPLCEKGSHTGSVVGMKTVGGKQAFQVQSLCPAAGVSAYFVDGDRVEVYFENQWILALDAPVAEGHTWSNGVDNYVWNKVGKISTSAGAFDDCWTAQQTNGNAQSKQSYTQFCRGVGPVKWHYVDTNGNGYDATLSSFKK